MGSVARPGGATEALAFPGRSQSGRSNKGYRRPRFASRNQCTGQDLAEAADPNEAAAPGEAERALGYTVDQGDRFYL